MTTPALEERYRRLLASFPADHRRTYGEEMIGVLLASAPAGQRRPGAADTLSLLGGGARVRLSRLMTGFPDPGWRDALALTSLVAPVVLTALVVRQNLGWIGRRLIVLIVAIPGSALFAARRSTPRVAS